MSYADVRKRTAEKMAGDERRMACMTCGESTTIETLSSFGARCFPCYQAYCREPFQQRPRSPAAERIRAEIAAAGKELPR